MLTKEENLEQIKEKEITIDARAGRLLKILRDEKVWSMEKLGVRAAGYDIVNGKVKLTSISRQTINQWENGTHSMSLRKLDQVCKALGITIKQFIDLVYKI